MSKEAVLKVKEAEAEAKRIINDANLKAKEMVEKAELKADSDCKKYEAMLSDEYKRRVEQVRSDALVLVDENRLKNQREAAWSEKKAREHMNDAVKIVLRRLIEECQ